MSAARQAVRPHGAAHRGRQALLLGTALQAAGVLVLALPFQPARAQPAPDARPVGGVVVAGSARISRAPGTTAIDQSSPRAAVNWRSFDIGAKQSVTFHQPSASAVTLNRVTGPNPSQIAGRITANGQVIVQNQDGITFYKGAQVNTAGFLATAAGITNRNFMAGRMVFDQPAAPGARVENRGRITVRQAGIAALVAPQVENSGVITAKLGQVVLAGAKTYALDLYGDGLISIDVNGAVTQVPHGPDGRSATALVTNTGTIVAAGGRIELTARQAAGVVQTLVTAGGTLAAPSLGARSGEIVLNGIGGSIVVAGQVLATGAAPGTRGGRIAVAPDGGVSLAATARLDASGAAGGGVVAVGTTAERARGGAGGTAAAVASGVTVARGAQIVADATARGDGGAVAVLSTGATVMDGAISARGGPGGGPGGGDGGRVELSGRTLGFDGAVDLGAPVGNVGTILFDPGTLDVVYGGSSPGSLDTLLYTPPATVPYTADGTTATDTVTNTAIDAAGSKAAVILQATTLLDVQAPIGVSNGLTLQSGGDLLIEASVSASALTVEAGRDLTLVGGYVSGSATAAGDIVMAAGLTDPTGVLTLGGPVVSQAGAVFLSSGAGGMVIDAPVVADQSGSYSPTSNGLVSLRTDALSFGTGASLAAGFGGIEVAPATQGLAMTVGGSGPGLVVPTLPVAGTGFPPNLRLGATTDPASAAVTTTAGAIDIAGPLYQGGMGGAGLTLDSTGDITQSAPLVGVGLLTGATGPVALTDPGNRIAELGPFTASGDFRLTDADSLLVAGGTVAADTISLEIGVPGGGNTLALGNGDSFTGLAVPQGGRISLLADTLAVQPPVTIAAPGGAVEIAPLTPGLDTLFAESAGTAPAGLVIDAAALAALQPGIAVLRIGAVTGQIGGQPGGQSGPLTGAISFAEPVDLTGVVATLDLDTTGTIGQGGGAPLAVDSLTGQAGAMTLDQANAVGTLGAFAVTGGLSLTDAGPLVAAGPLSAADVTLVATGSLTLAGDIALPSYGGPTVLLQVGPDTAGQARFVQTGVAGVGGAVPNGGTVTIGLPSTGGSASLADLLLPGMRLVLSLGDGTAGGTLSAGGLLVLGQGGSATLFGSVAGDGTPTAALISQIQPQVDPAYTMNGCVIGAAVCVASQPPPSPSPSPSLSSPSPQPQPQPPPQTQTPAAPQTVTTSVVGATAQTAWYAGLRQIIPGWLPPVPDLSAIDLAVIGTPPAPPDRLTAPGVAPPNISDLDY